MLLIIMSSMIMRLTQLELLPRKMWPKIVKMSFSTLLVSFIVLWFLTFSSLIPVGFHLNILEKGPLWTQNVGCFTECCLLDYCFIVKLASWLAFWMWYRCIGAGAGINVRGFGWCKGSWKFTWSFPRKALLSNYIHEIEDPTMIYGRLFTIWMWCFIFVPTKVIGLRTYWYNSNKKWIRGT